jgi:phytoene synthase
MLIGWYAKLLAVADRPTDPGVARLKLDWWRNELEQGLGGGSARHPLMQALLTHGLDDRAAAPMHGIIDVTEAMIRRPTAGDLDDFAARCRASGGGLFRLLCAPLEPSAYNAARCDALGGYHAAVERLCGRLGPGLPPELTEDAPGLPDAGEAALQRLAGATTVARDGELPETARRLLAVANGLHRKLARQGFRTNGRVVDRPPIAHLWTAWRDRPR